MHCNGLLCLFGILFFRNIVAFHPFRAIANTTQSPSSAGLSKFAVVSSKMGIGATAVKSSHDDKNTETFSSAFLLADNEQQCQKRKRTALIILNYPIPAKSLLLNHLWKTSCIRIAADGGANRLYEFSKELIPDRIRGDLDSLEPKVRNYYESHKVSIERDSCQDTNDLDKALQILDKQTIDRVVIYGAFGGRFDQEMASFAALYKWAPRFNDQLYLYSDETCALLIPADRECEIRLPFHDTYNLEEQGSTRNVEQDIGEGPTCGLIPLGCRCESIKTSGFQWDLDGSVPLEFGGLVSSSNRIMKPTVSVFASHPVVFTASIESKSSI